MLSVSQTGGEQVFPKYLDHSCADAAVRRKRQDNLSAQVHRWRVKPARDMGFIGDVWLRIPGEASR
jgi:hypothetical protein